MKKRSLLFHIILMVVNFLFASSQESPNTFLFCLKPELQPLELSLNRGKPSVGIVELDDYFQNHEVIRVEPWIKSATEMDRDRNIYLNRIYRVYLDDNIELDRDQSIITIQELSFILYAEPEYIRRPCQNPYTPNDPKYNYQCSLEAVKANYAWNNWDIINGEKPGDENIILASVDTGVDYTHPDLIENIWVNQGEIPEWAFEAPEVNSNEDDYVSALEISSFMLTVGDVNNDGKINLRDALAGVNVSPFMDGVDNDGNNYVDDIIGWDASGKWGIEDSDPFPKTGVLNDSEWAHGTHVAGILAATTDNAIGIASTMFNGKILSVKSSRDGSDESNTPINDGYSGITYAAKAGYYADARTIINCSWGGSGSNESEQAVINNAFNTYGAIIVAAAGNGVEDAHQEEYEEHFPASYKNVVSVCALSCNGNWGGWATYHKTVDLAAPGDNVYSTIIGGGYKLWDGSSMASPNASSVMGLVWSYHPSWTNEDVVEQVKLAADSSIYDINPDYIDCNGNEGSYCLGAGMIDAQKTIARGFSPKILNGPFLFTETLGDGDGIINPGETGYLSILLKNALGWENAEDIEAVLSTENSSVIIHDNNAFYGNITAGDSLYNIVDPYKIQILNNIELGGINFNMKVIGSGIYNYNHTLEYENISVNINQSGFPVSGSDIRSSPLVIDLDGDGDVEIIVGDNNGFVHIYNADGSEIQDDTFPYDTGNQIWGSAAAADMDLDGLLDFVITSKSKHLYIFDQNGLKTDYNANKYLMGTPAIGNLDGDADLEVVIGGYSSPASSSPIFAINPDGSDVEGFPFILGEKVKAGVALADFNGNGKDDIVVGTDSDNLHLIYDDGTAAPGFPYSTQDKIQAAPSVANINGEKVIFTGCNDDNFYAINSDGSFRFSIPTGDKVLSSPSFLDHNNKTYIFFGSNDDKIYAVDSDGNALSGWPVTVNGTIGGSVVFSDLDSDGEAEVIAATNMGDVLAFHLNGDYVNYFPILNGSPSIGSPMITELDSDGDLEILAGSGSNLFAVDIKEEGSTTDYWNMYRGGINRRGIFYINGGCMDVLACNYNIDAEIDNGTCIYLKENYDCYGNCISDYDECDVCGGPGAIYVCGCSEIIIGTCDCSGNKLDECGECGGDGPDIGYDCNGNPLSINDDLMPGIFSIDNIYPNPFNPIIHIKYKLPENIKVMVLVYNILGEKIEHLVSNFQILGNHSISWDASRYPSGVYIITMEAGRFRASRKVLLIK